MWKGLYLIAITSMVLFHYAEYFFNERVEKAESICWILKWISFASIFLITIAYGINLIINS